MLRAAGACAPQKCHPACVVPDFNGFSVSADPDCRRRQTEYSWCNPPSTDFARTSAPAEGRVRRVPARCVDVRPCSGQPTRAGSARAPKPESRRAHLAHVGRLPAPLRWSSGPAAPSRRAAGGPSRAPLLAVVSVTTKIGVLVCRPHIAVARAMVEAVPQETPTCEAFAMLRRTATGRLRD